METREGQGRADTTTLTWDDKTRGVKDIPSFAGACNFFRRCVPNFTHSSHLLRDLRKKVKKWHWGEEKAKQFQELKEKLENIGMLETPDSEGEFVVITNGYHQLVDCGGTLFNGRNSLSWWPVLLLRTAEDARNQP